MPSSNNLQQIEAEAAKNLRTMSLVGSYEAHCSGSYKKKRVSMFCMYLSINSSACKIYVYIYLNYDT